MKRKSAQETIKRLRAKLRAARAEVRAKERLRLIYFEMARDVLGNTEVLRRFAAATAANRLEEPTRKGG